MSPAEQGRQARIDGRQDRATLSGRLGHIPWPLLSLVSAQVAVSCGLSFREILTVNMAPL